MPNIIHETSKVSPWVDIEESSRGSILNIGSQTVIDSFVKIKFSGGYGDIIIKDRVYINSGCVFYSGNGIQIDDNVIIAANCVFAPVNHMYSHKDIPIRDQGFLPSKGGIHIEENVWIGAGSVILDGTVIKKGVVIGANSLVVGELEPYSVYVGSPAKLLRAIC